MGGQSIGFDISMVGIFSGPMVDFAELWQADYQWEHNSIGWPVKWAFRYMEQGMLLMV